MNPKATGILDHARAQLLHDMRTERVKLLMERADFVMKTERGAREAEENLMLFRQRYRRQLAEIIEPLLDAIEWGLLAQECRGEGDNYVLAFCLATESPRHHGRGLADALVERRAALRRQLAERLAVDGEADDL